MLAPTTCFPSGRSIMDAVGLFDISLTSSLHGHGSGPFLRNPVITLSRILDTLLS